MNEENKSLLKGVNKKEDSNNNSKDNQIIESQTTTSCSFCWTLNTLLMSLIGIGELAIPYGMKESGILLTIPVVLLVLFVTYYSATLIDDIVEQLGIEIHSLSDIGRCLPPAFDIIITLFVVIFLISAAASYFLFFVELLQNLACHLHLEYFCQNKTIIMQSGLIILIPLSMIPSISSYSMISLLKNIIVLLTFLIASVYAILYSKANGFDSKNVNLMKLTGFSTIFGIVSLSVELIGVVFEIRHEMVDRTEFKKVMKTSLFIGSFYYIVFPIIIYTGFNIAIKDIFLFNLPLDTFFGVFAQVGYSFGLLFTYPMQLFPIYIILIEVINGRRNVVREGVEETRCEFSKFGTWRFILLRISVTMMIFFMTWSFKNLIMLLEYVGAIVSSSLIFIIPVFSYEYLMSRFLYLERRFNKILNYLLLAFGIGVTIFNTYKIITKSEVKHSY